MSVSQQKSFPFYIRVNYLQLLNVCDALLLHRDVLSSAPFIACSHVILRRSESCSCILRFRDAPNEARPYQSKMQHHYCLAKLFSCICRSGDCVNSKPFIVAVSFAESERLVLLRQRYSVCDNVLSSCPVFFRSWARIFGDGAQEKSNDVEMRRWGDSAHVRRRSSPRTHCDREHRISNAMALIRMNATMASCYIKRDNWLARIVSKHRHTPLVVDPSKSLSRWLTVRFKPPRPPTSNNQSRGLPLSLTFLGPASIHSTSACRLL